MDRLAYYYFNLEIMKASLGPVLEGLVVTIVLAAIIVAIGLSGGVLLAMLRAMVSGWMEIPIIIYVDVFRSLPSIVVIVFIYFALPDAGLTLSPFWATAVGLSLVLVAYIQEAMWSAILAVPKGQWEAGRATGLSDLTIVMNIVFIPAFRIAIPAMTNRAIEITKGTALGSVVAAQEIIAQAQSMQSMYSNPSPLTLAALLYMALFAPAIALSRMLEKHLRRDLR